jgi:hypothetical protein
VLPTASAVELRDEAMTVLAALAAVATAGFLAASTLLGTALAVGPALQNQARPAPQHEVKAALQNQALISPWDLATLTAARKARPAPWDVVRLTAAHKMRPAPWDDAAPAPWEI